MGYVHLKSSWLLIVLGLVRIAAQEFRLYSTNNNASQGDTYYVSGDPAIRGGRIVGGRPANKGEFPFAASLQTSIDNRHFCGGIMLSDRHVLTACHCLTLRGAFSKPRLRYPRSIIVVVGAINLEDLNAQRLPAGQLFVHPKCVRYNTGLVYDVGAVITEPFGSIQFVPRSAYYFNLGGGISRKDRSIDVEAYLRSTELNCTAFGWGSTIESGPSSGVLLTVDLEMISQKDCELYLNSYAKTVHEELRFGNQSQFCTLGPEGRDACSGDSGGPLLCDLPGVKEKMLTAVTSWGIGCGRPEVPGTWARIDRVELWLINDILPICHAETDATVVNCCCCSLTILAGVINYVLSFPVFFVCSQ